MKQNVYMLKNILIAVSAIAFCINAAAQNYTITTVAGLGFTTTPGNPSGPIGGTFSGDGGPALNAGLWFPSGITIDAQGNIYFADSSNGRIRKISANTGIITTVAGNGGAYSGDGGPATSAAIGGVLGVAVDAQGNQYITAPSNNRIRKVDAVTGIITTIAGNGTAGFSGDGGLATAALLSQPGGITLDVLGNIYVADNSRIRKIDVNTGIITTIAGGGINPVNLGDGGQATAAQIDPKDIAIDTLGNIFIADMINCRIRKVNASTGIITTIAGTTSMWNSSGDGGLATAAEIALPFGIDLDAFGNVYLSEGASGSNRVRKINASTGIITTIAGTASPGFMGDCGPAIAARLYGPWGVEVDAQGDVFIVDAANCRIRKLTTKPLIAAVATQTTLCMGAGATLSVSSTSALNSMTSCAWSSGATSASINVTPTISTTYFVTGNVVTGLNNFCQNTATLHIQVNALPGVSVNSSPTLVCSGNPVILTPGGASTYSVTGGSFTVNPITNSSYTVTGTDNNACQNTAIAHVSVLVLPNITIHANSNTICISETTTLSASGANTYTWGYSSNGSTWWVSNTNISANPGVSTTYTVQGLGNNGCVGTNTHTLYVHVCTGIDGFKTPDLKIYPNPANAVLHLENFNPNEELFVSFIDMYGREVLQTKLQPQINLQDLANGVYILRLGTANKIVHQQKLIKE